MMTNPFTKTALKKSMVRVNAVVSVGFLAPTPTINISLLNSNPLYILRLLFSVRLITDKKASSMPNCLDCFLGNS